MKQYKSALLFGTFHPLHDGHISLIRRAYEICDKIYLVADSDDYVKKKGRNPLLSISERIKNLESLKGVEVVGVEDDLFNKKYWIDLLEPEILIKGDDWLDKNWEGEKLLKTIYLKHTKGIHSTDLYKKYEI